MCTLLFYASELHCQATYMHILIGTELFLRKQGEVLGHDSAKRNVFFFPERTTNIVWQKGPTHERAPTPYFLPNFLYRIKVYSNERPPWSELRVEFEKHGLERRGYLW